MGNSFVVFEHEYSNQLFKYYCQHTCIHTTPIPPAYSSSSSLPFIFHLNLTTITFQSFFSCPLSLTHVPYAISVCSLILPSSLYLLMFLIVIFTPFHSHHLCIYLPLFFLSYSFSHLSNLTPPSLLICPPFIFFCLSIDTTIVSPLL